MILPPIGLRRLGAIVSFALALMVTLPSRPFAHDIPASVKLLAFVKPEGGTLRVVMRAPLEAMRDVNFPQRGPGYLDVAAAEPLLADAAKVWIADDFAVFEGDEQLAPPTIAAARISLPSDRSFTSYETALAHARLAARVTETDLLWKQAMLDVVLEYRISSDRSSFAIRPSLARLGVRTVTALRFIPPSGSERAFEYAGDPGLVRLDPRWHQAALRFVTLGFQHILGGIDHLLFVFCLVIPFRRLRPLIAIVTAFTVAHSITLFAAASGMVPDALWFPPLIEVLIALSIVYMALENIVGAKLERRWMLAFGFGLVHGFGFSFALRESLQFAGAHLTASLLAFNVGVEIGQVLVLAVAIPLLGFAFRRIVAERMGTIILSVFVAHTAWHWMLERGTVLTQYRLVVPALNASFAAAVIRGVMLALVAAGVAWAMTLVYRRFLSLTPGVEAE